MANCQWCEKELPEEGANVCGSCVFRPIEESLDDSDPETGEQLKINFDMSILGEKKTSKSKRAGQLKADLFLNSLVESPISTQEILMKTVKVKSNSIRGRAFVVGGELVLNFDDQGVAECLESDVPTIKAYMRVRPNRLTIVEEPKKAAPAPKKVEKKAEKKTERVERKVEKKAAKAEERKPKSEEPRPAKKAEKSEKKDAE